MLGQLLPPFHLPPWQTWLAPLAGILSAGLALLISRALSKHRTSAPDVVTEATPPPGQVERRKSPRRGGRPVKILVSDMEAQANPSVAWVQNRSLGGLCLSVTQQYEVGEILSIRTATAQNSIPWVQVEVKYCYLRDESWLVGCRFVATPPWNIMLLFD